MQSAVLVAVAKLSLRLVERALRARHDIGGIFRRGCCGLDLAGGRGDRRLGAIVVVGVCDRGNGEHRRRNAKRQLVPANMTEHMQSPSMGRDPGSTGGGRDCSAGEPCGIAGIFGVSGQPVGACGRRENALQGLQNREPQPYIADKVREAN